MLPDFAMPPPPPPLLLCPSARCFLCVMYVHARAVIGLLLCVQLRKRGWWDCCQGGRRGGGRESSFCCIAMHAVMYSTTTLLQGKKCQSDKKRPLPPPWVLTPSPPAPRVRQHCCALLFRQAARMTMHPRKPPDHPLPPSQLHPTSTNPVTARGPHAASTLPPPALPANAPAGMPAAPASPEAARTTPRPPPLAVPAPPAPGPGPGPGPGPMIARCIEARAERLSSYLEQIASSCAL